MVPTVKQTISVEMTESAAAHDAVALIAPLGVDTEFQRFVTFQAPKGWDTTIVAEPRTGQRAAVLVPPQRNAAAVLRQTFAVADSDANSGPASTLPDNAYIPERTALTTAAAALAHEAQAIAASAGGGLDGIAAIVADTSARFDYGNVPGSDGWYAGQDSVPVVACMVGNCVDINTYLVAALRAVGYDASYLTCYFFDDNPNGIASGMHCWVRTRCDGVVQDWDIAHFKKAGRSDVSAMMNPIPGRRFALAYGRDHTYRWNGIDIRLSTPSRPNWVRGDGSAVWGRAPIVRLV
jgi:hypothetical protein